MHYLSIKDIEYSVGDCKILHNITFSLSRGECIVFMGPSGSGKTSILNVILGSVKFKGEIEIKHTPSAGQKPTIYPLMQNAFLYPHMTVWNNIAFGLKNTGITKEEINSRIVQALATLEIAELRNRFLHELSGGQAQRAALAKALVHQPDILLLDEPLSALETDIRITICKYIRKLQQRLNLTTIYVTHSPLEAQIMADKIAVMHEGTIQQIGTWKELTRNPASEFIKTTLTPVF